jgi:nucleoside-diphosphate-sugar epimerase
VDLLCEITGRQANIETDDKRIRPRESEVDRLVADNALIRELTGWRSLVSFKDGLTRTVEWVRANLRYFDAGGYAR